MPKALQNPLSGLGYTGSVCRFPVYSKRIVDLDLAFIRNTGLAHRDNTAIFEREPRCQQAMGSKLSPDRTPCSALAGRLKPIVYPAQQMIGQYRNEYMPVNAVFFLMEIGTQAQGALQHFEAGFGFQQCHVEVPQLLRPELLIGSQNVVAAQVVGCVEF